MGLIGRTNNDFCMTKNTILEHIAFLKFCDNLSSFTWSLSHNIMLIRINLLSDRLKSTYTLRLEIFLHTQKNGTNSIDKSITFNSFFELHCSFKIIYLGEKWKKNLSRKKMDHIRLVSLGTHNKILIISLGTSKRILKSFYFFHWICLSWRIPS